MMGTIAKVALSAAISMLGRLVTEDLFEYLFVTIAEAAAKSSKTKWDDNLVARIKTTLGKK